MNSQQQQALFSQLQDIQNQQYNEESLLRVFQQFQSYLSTLTSEQLEFIGSNMSLRFFEILKANLEDHQRNTGIVMTIVDIFNIFVLNGTQSCVEMITSNETGLLSIFMKKIRSAPNDKKLTSSLESLFSNCSCFPVTHDSLVSTEINWLAYIHHQMLSQPNNTHYYWLLNNFIVYVKNVHLRLLIEYTFPSILLQKLISYGLMNTWKSTDKLSNSIPRFCVSSIMYLSKLPTGYQHLKELFTQSSEYSNTFLDLMNSSTMFGLRATILLANLYGRDETVLSCRSSSISTKSASLLMQNQEILPLLINLMDTIMNYDINRKEVQHLLSIGFTYGFQLSIVVIALKNLSISDENKAIMIEYPKLYHLICQGIHLYFINAPECKGQTPGNSYYDSGGGGGQDEITFENCLELLLQLTFYYEKDEDFFRSSFFFPSSSSAEKMDYNLVAMLTSLLQMTCSTNSLNKRTVSFEATQFLRQLLNRFQRENPFLVNHPVSNSNNFMQETTKAITTNRIVETGKPQHIMFSYCWGAKNKNLVIELAKQLRELGYDVWRDVEGSSILPPMSGDIVETMANAVEMSHTVIIFVSPEYKQSANCHSEAKYARTRAITSNIKGKTANSMSSLQLLYVMVNENYHTHSSPEVVDGWLGFMVGTELWHPLWHEDQVKTTANTIAGIIGNHARLDANAAFLTSSSSAKVVVPSLLSSKDTNNVAQPQPLWTPYSISLFQLKLPENADLETAFSYLNDKKAIYPEVFRAFLQHLSITSAEDLRDIEVRTLIGLASMLKIGPAERFLKALRL